MQAPSKTCYRIREVAALLDIPAYTLRYWEDVFPMLIPDRTPTGQRRYSREQVELVRRIKEMLYERGIKTETAVKILNSSYRKFSSPFAYLCKSKADASKLLKSVKVSLQDANAIAKIEAVERWIKQR